MAGKAGLEQYGSFVHVHTPWVAREANDELVVLKLWVPSEMDSVAGEGVRRLDITAAKVHRG